MINLLYLKYFCDAVKLGGVSASAKENFVSQSAISQGIAKLERSLKKELITHHPNRFKVTQEGRLVFEKSLGIFKSLQELDESLSDGTAGRLEFACMHSFALAILPKKLKELKRLYPKLQVSFRLGHTDQMLEWLKKGIIEFGICLDNDDLSGFDCHQIYEGQYRTYVAQNVKAGTELSFILSEERMETNLLKSAYRKKFKKEMAVLMEVSSWEVIANLTEEGVGYGFFPDYVAERRKSLAVHDLGLAPLHYKVYAIVPKAQKISTAARLFFNAFEQPKASK
jgi:DNA-binding transcriptional LysR family regulator